MTRQHFPFRVDRKISTRTALCDGIKGQGPKWIDFILRGRVVILENGQGPGWYFTLNLISSIKLWCSVFLFDW
ncbi:uncharacterized protein DS421_11g322600 [Arachis hypogaea]|nr:uncharacterized protein DS421_11g322600 [Arachis hypogaea]